MDKRLPNSLTADQCGILSGTYLSFADYYEERGLKGFANWYLIQAQEERDHALIMRNYLHSNGEKVTLSAIDEPGNSFGNDLEPLEAALLSTRSSSPR